MRLQGGGRIINIGSVLGFLPMPYGVLYAATKHAIEGYSASLDHELAVTPPAGARVACDSCADLRLLGWWTLGFEKTCSSTQ